MKLPRSFYARPEIIGGQQCAEAHLVRCVSPCRCLVTAVAGLLGSVRPAELSWLLIDRAAFGRWSLWTASQRSGVVAAAGNARGACHAVRRRSVFTIGCPPIRFRCPGPVVQRSGVQPSGVQPSGIRSSVSSSGVRPSGRPVSARPASGRLVSTRPSGHLRLGRVSPAVALGITSLRRETFTTGTDRVARGLRCPERLGRPSGSAWRGRRCGGVGRSVGERPQAWPGQARAEAGCQYWGVGNCLLA